jgi:hypothetical protein
MVFGTVETRENLSLISLTEMMDANSELVPSSYSYECKECTIKRVVSSRMVSKVLDKWEYPDW